MPPKLVIVLVIIIALCLGAGTLTYGLTLENYRHNDEQAFFTAVGAGILASSSAALVTLLLGGFRGLDDRDEF